MRTAVRLALGFMVAYAPALGAMAALPALSRLDLGAAGFILFSCYLFFGAPFVWLRLDRVLARPDRRHAPLSWSAQRWPMRPPQDPRDHGGRGHRAPGSDEPAPSALEDRRRRLRNRTLLSLALLHLAAWQVLSAPVASAFFMLTGAVSGLALMSMVADVQTLKRRGRNTPDRRSLPIYALTVGTFFAAVMLAIWRSVAVGLA